MKRTSRILVVDDNEAGRYAVVRCLRGDGLEVREASTGRDCYQHVARGDNDLILLDVKLPDISGIEVCRQLKGDPRTASIPVIQMSALFTETHDRITGLESGADVYLASPVNPKELLVHVHGLLRMREVENELRQSEARYRLLFDKNPDCVFCTDPSGRFTEVNPASERLSGYSRAELLNKSFVDLCAPDCQPETMARFQRSLSNPGYSEMETAMIRKDGRRVELLVSGEPLMANGSLVALHCTAKDISRRKRTERALKLSMDRYRQQARLIDGVVSTTPDFVYLFDLQGHFLYANKRLLEVWGMRLADVLGKTCLELGYAQWHHEMHMREIAQVIETSKPIKGEVPFKAPRTGIAGVYEYIFTPVFGQDGKVELIAGTTRDITERKMAEEKLRESEERFRTMADGLPLLVWVHNAAGEQEFVNLTFCEFFGVPREQMQGEAWKALLHPDDAERYSEEFLRCVSERRPFHAEARVRNAEGEWRWVESWARPRFSLSGEFLGFVGASKDVTQRRAAEWAVRESRDRLMEAETRLRLAQSAAGVGIHDLNLITGEFHWDDRMRELWSLGPAEPLSHGVFVAGIHPEDRALVDQAIAEACRPSGEGRFYVEHRLAKGNVWIAATGHVTFDNGRAVRLIGTAQDITDRKRFEEELEKLVAERTAKLHEMVAELEHFSYSITHDMRAPLRAMRGFAEVVSEMCPCGSDPQMADYLGRIIGSAERMDSLITDALRYARTLRQDIPLTRIDTHRLLCGMLDSYPEFLRFREHIHIDGHLPPVLGNEAALTQCFSNLVGNALKFVAPGQAPEVRISAETITDPPGEGCPSPPPTWVRLWVEDRGIGITENMLPRVFDMFSRGGGNYEGTGVGLALVRKVVQRMGGRVGVDSQRNQGSRFHVDLAPGDSSRL